MLFSRLNTIAVLALRAQAWKLTWYGGININCSVVQDTTDFYVRTYQGGQLPSPCVPEDGSAPGVGCSSEFYDYGVVASSEGCDRDTGRGSASVEGGCCRFYSSETCGGSSYDQVAPGECLDNAVITGFICDDTC